MTSDELESRLKQAEAFDNAVERTAVQSGPLYIGGFEPEETEEIRGSTTVEVYTRDESRVLEALTAVLINLQRDFDTFKNTVGNAFKEIGHAHTWAKIAGE
jgi:hypothetical protein